MITLFTTACAPAADRGTSGAGPSGVGFGYSTPQAALDALRGRRDVTISTQDGWTTATDRANATLWTFTTMGHPAHPAGIRRQIVERGTILDLDTNFLCNGPRQACDQLAEDFKRLNARMLEDLRRQRGG
jgi:hypothetical protein